MILMEDNILDLKEKVSLLNKELNKKDIRINEQDKEIERLNNIINECADDILKELKENNHLSYGVALSIRQKLIDYKELKENNNE